MEAIKKLIWPQPMPPALSPPSLLFLSPLPCHVTTVAADKLHQIGASHVQTVVALSIANVLSILISHHLNRVIREIISVFLSVAKGSERGNCVSYISDWIIKAGFTEIGVGAVYYGLKPVIEFMQCFVALYGSVPGIKVLTPYSSEDAGGLLKAAIRDPDPIVFLENELIYEESFPVSLEVLDSSFCLPIGKAKSKKRDLSLEEKRDRMLQIFYDSQDFYLSKKRGLSLEEKRERMLQIFYDSQDFYLLKELEKMGPKKGVISQSVKDVIQTLVDDDLVLKDKIGTSVYFWSLPSCAGNQLRNVRRKLEEDLENSKKKLAELVEQCDALKKGREESDERQEALDELKAVEQKYNELKDEMGKYAENDPAAFEAMRESIAVAHSAANRWTDNIFTLRQWCTNNFPQAKEQLEHLYAELKELEKMGPKKCVISQTVKDVIQSLVDDDLLLKDKIGTCVYFWSLPSCAGNQERSKQQLMMERICFYPLVMNSLCSLGYR